MTTSTVVSCRRFAKLLALFFSLLVSAVWSLCRCVGRPGRPERIAPTFLIREAASSLLFPWRRPHRYLR
ncbi:hypothetical protein, partial [Mycolicibacterium fortuitum]|uniref:hypothetical protein n=1 Tax=Mycolicibacterium fortuitum TaxID=1766 RepID=UPI00241C036D